MSWSDWLAWGTKVLRVQKVLTGIRADQSEFVAAGNEQSIPSLAVPDDEFPASGQQDLAR
jgi:hypothetical protein